MSQPNILCWQQLIRVLGLHWNGIGYALLRRHLEELVPSDHALRKVWLNEGDGISAGEMFRENEGSKECLDL